MKLTNIVLAALLAALVLTAGCAYHFGDEDAQDLSIIRVDASGAEMWRHTIDSGFGGGFEAILSVAPTPEGGVFVSHYYLYPPSSHPDKALLDHVHRGRRGRCLGQGLLLIV